MRGRENPDVGGGLNCMKTVWVGTAVGHEVPVHLWAAQKFYENVAY
jgi:hypothetical protein